jgi:hypothetical protein
MKNAATFGMIFVATFLTAQPNDDNGFQHSSKNQWEHMTIKRYEKQDFAKRPRSYWEFVHGFTPCVRKPSRCGVTCGCITIPSTKSWYS